MTHAIHIRHKARHLDFAGGLQAQARVRIDQSADAARQVHDAGSCSAANVDGRYGPLQATGSNQRLNRLANPNKIQYLLATVYG